ncbi:MAG: tetratricopeptide repeat protein [Planctomycetaceae bacterium]
MRLLPRFLRRSSEPQFVEARPGLSDVVLAFRYGRGVSRWIRLAWSLATFPIRLCWRVFVWIVLLPWRLFSASFQGLRHRRIRHLVQGLPALAAAVAVAATAAVAASRRTELSGDYREAAAARFAAEDWEGAKLYYERLFRLDGGSAESRLFLGLTYEQMGAVDEARGLIEGVAAGDGGGDPRANRWVASRLLADPDNFRNADRLHAARRHLLLAERGLPQDPGIKLDLAKYYLATGQPNSAIPKLAAAAVAQPALYLDLAKLYGAVGQGTSAKKALERAERHFREALGVRPEDRQVRLLLASTVANLGRLEDAVAVLRDGMTFDSKGPYRQAIAKIYLSAYDRLAARKPRDYRAMIAALREALRDDPQSVEAAERLAGFGEAATPGPSTVAAPVDPEVDREAREMLQGLLASGEQPAAVHMALGLKAWRSGDLETAGFHFERAYDLDSSLSGVANNLAWVLTHQDEPDLERALATISPVIERFPDVTNFRDTRGEIYLRLGDWESAIADFERALPGLRDNSRIHESLATAYERLGHAEIAMRHRREAERLRPAGEAVEDSTTSVPQPVSEPVEARRPS